MRLSRLRWPCRLAASALALAASLGAASANLALVPTGRVAVVVGNGDYDNVPDLPNAVTDATRMADLLTEFGYDVFAATDLDRQGFESLLREVILNVPDGSEVVFFYAGHGIQIGARNYLLPTDAEFATPHDLPLYSITLDRVIEALSARGTVHVAFIDACRENPFPGLQIAADMSATLYDTQEGFQPFRTPLNSLVAFSTSPGQRARDGEAGDGSPYTNAILSVARAAPDSDVLSMLGQVREAVYNETGGQQVPWESSTLVAPFRLVEAAMTLPALQEAGDDGGTDGPSRAGAAPVEVALDLTLERYVRLDDAVLAAAPDLTAADVAASTLATAPRFGEVAFAPDGGGIWFRPGFRERDVTETPDYRLTDRLRIEVGDPDARRIVTVDLTLEPDPCDLQAGDLLDLDGVGLFRFANDIDVPAAVAACEAAVTAAPEVSRFHYQYGRALRAAGRFEEARDAFETAVAMGHIRAHYALALMLTTPRIDRAVHDIPEDPARAVDLLEIAIAAGDPFAMHTRGRDLFEDGATDADRARGFELVDRAAELGHTYSMNLLGFHFLREDTDHYIPDRGMAYLTASAARGDIFGVHALGIMAQRGVQGTPDPVAARAFYEEAMAGGHPNSPVALGRLVARGEGGPADPVAAVALYDEGLSRGDGWGGYYAARLILEQGLAEGPEGAAIRAAKAALLSQARPAEESRAILAGLDPAVVDRALQLLLVDLGADLIVDGQVGSGTTAELARLAGAEGLPVAVPADPVERLIAAARIHWARNPLRDDVF